MMNTNTNTKNNSTNKMEGKKMKENTNKKSFDYGIFNMTQKEFKSLSFGMFLQTVDLMNGTTDVLAYVNNNKKDFARFNIDLTEETVIRVLVPSITKIIKKTEEKVLSFVTFKRLLKGEFNDRLFYNTIHRATAPKAPKAREVKVTKKEMERIERLCGGI